MNIIIAGAGEVGKALATTLNSEKHSVTLIDINADTLQEACASRDVMGVVGNATSYAILMEAGIEGADLLIAVTGNDEINLLCCVMGRKAEECNTIARVRNPSYHNESGFLKDELEISMIINPELIVADEIARILRLPSASSIEVFSKGLVEMVRYKIKEDSILCNLNLIEIGKKVPSSFLIGAIERNKEVIIPKGNTTLSSGDYIHVIASPTNLNVFFSSIGEDTHQVRTCMIVGGGVIGYYLANTLYDLGVKTTIVEAERSRCEELSLLLPKAIIINSEATKGEVLLEEGLEKIESFVSLTNLDEENIMASLYASKVSNAKIITKVKRSIFHDMVKDMNVGSTICLEQITADHILSYVRALENSYGSSVETLYKLVDDKVEALEFQIKQEAKCLNIPLSEIKLKKDLLVACINRNGEIMIPKGTDIILIGDTVIVVTTQKGLEDINDILE